MKYLVTGGAGFVGSHLCEYLLAHGHSVCVVDNLSTGSASNVAHLRDNPRLTVVFAELSDPYLMAELVDNVDAVFHLAAAVGVKLIVTDPVHTIETNILGTELVLKLAAKKSKKVLLTSTSEIYGKSINVPFCEDDDMLFGPSTRGRWSYACSKAIDEFLSLAYHRQFGMPVVIARLFNTVGPRQTGHYGMVLPRFVGQALRNQPISVYGDGTQTRCFGHVADVVRGLAALMDAPQAVGEIFNLGNNEEVSINQLAEMVRDMAGSSSSIIHVPYSEAYGENFEDMPRRVPSFDKAAKLVGYRPTFTVREIIASVIEYVAGTIHSDSGAGATVNLPLGSVTRKTQLSAWR
jgi:UDP-glucose 4-epimerase